MEQATKRSRSSEDYRAAIECGLGTAREMKGLVERLLSLARLGNAAVTAEISDVPIGLLVEGALEVFAPEVARKGLRVRLDLPEGIGMRTDPALFQIALNNLVENAVNYADVEGEIAIRSRQARPVTS